MKGKEKVVRRRKKFGLGLSERKWMDTSTIKVYIINLVFLQYYLGIKRNGQIM